MRDELLPGPPHIVNEGECRCSCGCEAIHWNYPRTLCALCQEAADDEAADRYIQERKDERGRA